MAKRLTGKTAIVTGSSQGIGEGIAKRFAAEGATVVINARTLDRARAVAASIEAEATGGRAIAIEADVADRDAVQVMVDATVEQFGRIDILVNNAGVFSSAPFLELEPADWDHVIDVNLTGVFNCAQLAGREMATTGGGQMINISSMSASFGLQGREAYCSAKAGVNNLTRSLAVSLSEHAIQVNALAPGYIWIEGRTDAKAGETAKETTDWPAYSFTVRDIRNRVPMGRFGRVDEIANCAVFLAEGNHYVNGEILHADGGWRAFGWGSKEE